MTKDLGTTLSPKVVAGTFGAGAGAIVTTAVTWALGAGAFGAGWSAAEVEAAMAAVPAPLVALAALGIGVAFTFIPAWWIRDHVREEGAALIANTAPGVRPSISSDEHLAATGLEVQDVLDRHLAAEPDGTMTYGGSADADLYRAVGLPDDGATDQEEDPPARGR